MANAITKRLDGQRDGQTAGGSNTPVNRNVPSVSPAQPEFRHNPRVSNDSGAASMPQVMVGFSINTNGLMVLQANPARGYLMIQNNSADDVFVAYDGLARAGSAYRIGPGGYFEPRVVPTNSVYLSSNSLTNAETIVIEGNR